MDDAEKSEELARRKFEAQRLITEGWLGQAFRVTVKQVAYELPQAEVTLERHDGGLILVGQDLLSDPLPGMLADITATLSIGNLISEFPGVAKMSTWFDQVPVMPASGIGLVCQATTSIDLKVPNKITILVIEGHVCIIPPGRGDEVRTPLMTFRRHLMGWWPEVSSAP